MLFRQTTIRGIAVAPRSSFDRMNKFLNEHKIRPVIDQVYPFDQARQAYEHLARSLKIKPRPFSASGTDDSAV
jgi:D-arabinose 1-dehydrogenase-like Zn-dependent alcohol dehydrogenase